MKTVEIKSLYYITHVDNIPSIVEQGILAHAIVDRDHIQYTPIYDASIVSNRRDKHVPAGESLWHFSNLYFQPRNPMMYRVVHEKSKDAVAVVAVRPSIIDRPQTLLTDGNAANNPTNFYPPSEGIGVIRKQWEIIQSEWWRSDDGSKRKIMAECLVPERVPPEYIHTIYVSSSAAANKLKGQIKQSNVPIVAEPHMFFQPHRASQVGKRTFLIHGDMFFSGMQTLTVSVNLQGIMGKGLASRAKYQFPDVYVYYQDACRKKRLTATRPCLYKREISFDEELADLPNHLHTPNAVKWFLLFATKRRWRDNSRLEDIEAGLDWLQENYQKEGIKSLALPALGCGLGGLDWKQVGPLMCRYLNRLSINTAIYLPREREIENKYLTHEFLLENPSGTANSSEGILF